MIIDTSGSSRWGMMSRLLSRDGACDARATLWDKTALGVVPSRPYLRNMFGNFLMFHFNLYDFPKALHCYFV